MFKISFDSTLQARPGLLWREVDGEVVLLDPSRGRYYGIEGIGVEAWRLLQQKTTFSRLLEQLHEEFEVGKETLQEDLQDFLSKVIRAGLLTKA